MVECFFLKKIFAFGIALFLLLPIFSTAGVFANAPFENERGPLEKIVFTHYKKSTAKPSGAGPPNGAKGAANCYAFLSTGAKWKSTEPYFINPSNNDGISESTFAAVASNSVSTWENRVSYDIFGNAIVDYNISANIGLLDEINSVSFGDIENPGAIGVTIVWGYFSGPQSTRELVEWDMVLDDTDYVWGDSAIDASKMDLQNILTHELGHSLGLADLYDFSCQEETMFGYSSAGETKKRDLAIGDIKGIQKLYS